jgi:hypothetical protein
MRPQSVPFQDFSQPIVDPRTGLATSFFDTLMRALINRTGGASDKVDAAHALASAAVPRGTEVVAGGGLQDGGRLGGNVGVALYRAMAPVENLPAAAQEGDWAYALDGLKPGESSGSGTGAPVFWANGGGGSACSGATVEA